MRNVVYDGLRFNDNDDDSQKIWILIKWIQMGFFNQNVLHF